MHQIEGENYFIETNVLGLALRYGKIEMIKFVMDNVKTQSQFEFKTYKSNAEELIASHDQQHHNPLD